MKKVDAEVGELIEKILGKKGENEIDAFSENCKLADQLSERGSIVVEPILDKLFTLKSQGKLEDYFDRCGRPVYHLVKVATEHAGPEHAQKLAQMLLWDEICFEEDCSKRSNILDALERVGRKEIVPLLKHYAEKVKLVAYLPLPGMLSPEETHQLDQKEALRVIEACQEK